MKKSYLAFDLGAESGRAIHGEIIHGKLILNELSRFPNGCINVRGRYHWNILNLLGEIRKGLFTAKGEKMEFSSIGIDSWGVDFGLLSKDGTLLSMPYAYRDLQTQGMIEKLTGEVISRYDLYMKTGIQLIQFNSIFQLYAMKRNKSPLLDVAESLLFTPDLLNYFLTGIKKAEFSIASTSQLLNPFTRSWNNEIIRSIEIKSNMFQEIIMPGNIIGNLDNELASECGLENLPVVAVASHDTQSAITAVPARGRNWAYLSSGTWSLMGIETDEPIINPKSAEKNYTNEGGAEGKYCFLKNMCGLWILQQCKKIWDVQHNTTYEELVRMAEKAKPFSFYMDTDYSSFYNPNNMPSEILSYCKITKQSLPENNPQIVRSILENMALKYKSVLDELNEFSKEKIEILYVIGGGAKNKLLCQFTANALGIPVITGPSEATAVGNLLMQAKALGHVSSLEEIREISKNSFESETFVPQDKGKWNEAYERWLKVVNL